VHLVEVHLDLLFKSLVNGQGGAGDSSFVACRQRRATASWISVPSSRSGKLVDLRFLILWQSTSIG